MLGGDSLVQLFLHYSCIAGKLAGHRKSACHPRKYHLKEAKLFSIDMLYDSI